ncbi:MAG: DUF721 domain-containing protein [Rickettsiaceae bacterium]|nr:DUF721 domain-containing protein [Rickettsiaceae bacterium]
MKPIADELERVLRPIFARHGKIFAELMVNWQKISGVDLGAKTSPYKITTAAEKGRKINILHVKVANSATGLEFTYQQDIIIERIAIYFGYKAVDKIIVKT